MILLIGGAQDHNPSKASSTSNDQFMKIADWIKSNLNLVDYGLDYLNEETGCTNKIELYTARFSTLGNFEVDDSEAISLTKDEIHTEKWSIWIIGSDSDDWHTYGIYDNDYANVASGSATLKNNFISSQSEFQKNIIQAITNIMKDGTYKYYQEFQTLRVTPTIDSENKKNLIWDSVNHSIMQKFYIFYGSESQAPTTAQQIAAVKDYIKRLHTSGHCHPMKYDDDGNITYIGHSDTDLDMFLSKMYPELFTTTEVYIIPTNTMINKLGDKYDPDNYFGTSNIEDTHDQIKNLNGVFSLFEYASNGRASLVSSGEKQKNLPIEFIHIGSLNGQETSGQNSLDLRYPMPLICTAFGTTDARPLTSLSGFANYETKIFNYNQSNMNTFNYADKLQIVLIKLMEAMFTNDNNASYYSSIAGVKIDYEIDRNADSDLQTSGYKKNVAKFVINNVNFTVIAHKGKAFAKSLNHVEV